MKERFDITISGIPLSVVSDDEREFVDKTVKIVDEYVDNLVLRSKHCSKLEAVILCALDFCGEKEKANKRIRCLEAQVELLEANNRRLRKAAGKSTDNAEEAQTEHAPDAVSEKAEKPADKPKLSRAEKLHQLEALLGGQLSMDTDKKQSKK